MKEYQEVSKFFEESKGITIDSAHRSGAKYSAVTMARFAEKYHQWRLNNSEKSIGVSDGVESTDVYTGVINRAVNAEFDEGCSPSVKLPLPTIPEAESFFCYNKMKGFDHSPCEILQCTSCRLLETKDS